MNWRTQFPPVNDNHLDQTTAPYVSTFVNMCILEAKYLILQELD